MRRPSAKTTMPLVPGATQIRLTLLVDDVEPLRGSVEPEAGSPQPFSGWTGLAAALDRALKDRPSPPAPTEGERPPSR